MVPKSKGRKGRAGLVLFLKVLKVEHGFEPELPSAQNTKKVEGKRPPLHHISELCEPMPTGRANQCRDLLARRD